MLKENTNLLRKVLKEGKKNNMFRILEEDAKHFDDTEGVTCIYGIFMFLDSEQELLEDVHSINKFLRCQKYLKLNLQQS